MIYCYREPIPGRHPLMLSEIAIRIRMAIDALCYLGDSP